MQYSPGRILRATVLAGLATLVLATHVFVTVDRVRIKVLETPATATGAQVRISTAAFPQVSDLRPPFALIARINNSSPGTSSFSIAVDGSPVCARDIARGGARRVDCAVAGTWDPAIAHQVTIQGPSTAWELVYLELATHHGNTDGLHYLVILPGSSERYLRPSFVWVIATGLLVAGLLLLTETPPMPRWIRWPYRMVAGVVVLELAVSVCSPWVSDYRIVFSTGTYARFLILLLGPRLWATGRVLTAQRETYPPVQRTVRQAAVVVMGGAIGWALLHDHIQTRWEQFQASRRAAQARTHLFAELQPVKLANCDFKRFGEANDGGYVLCANLLNAVGAGYSYGISGYDQWGCDVARAADVTVHQYDCFNLTVPVCAGGRTVFHGECIGDKPASIDGRPFDTLENQFVKNGDGGKQVVVKMDVEGAEWDSLLQTPDAVLARIDQLTIEMHGLDEYEQVTAAVAKLKRFFHVANMHFNNFACGEGYEPFPADVYEVLFVSKRLGVAGGAGPVGAPPGMMTPNVTHWSDCQSLADLPQVRHPKP